MFKKTLYFFYIFFAFIPSIIMADIIDKQEVVKVNGISMYRNVAEKILNKAGSATIEKREDVITKTMDISISASELMDVISDTYKKIISSNYGGSQETVYANAYTRPINGKSILVHIYVNKKEKLISSLDIEKDDK